jgi:calcineurin-like phosphoesterase family protein
VTRFFTSDTHIGHRLVAGKRGFGTEENPDVEAHAQAVAGNWDRVVGKRDDVYVLGDISMNATPAVFDWFDERPGRKILIPGNHDEVHPAHRTYLKAFPEWSKHFAAIAPFMRIKFGRDDVLLSHFPYWGEGSRPGPDRYTEYRLRDVGVPLLHGHTHGQERAHGYQFHVGLDAHGLQLVHEEQVAHWLVILAVMGKHAYV